MEFSNQFNTVKLGWFIIYFEVSLIKFPKFAEFQYRKIAFILANSADLDEMWPHFIWVYIVSQSFQSTIISKHYMNL